MFTGLKIMDVGFISWGCMASCQSSHVVLGSCEQCRLQVWSIFAWEVPQVVLDVWWAGWSSLVPGGETSKENIVDLQVEHGQFKLPSLAGIGWTLHHGMKCSHAPQGAASTRSSKAPLSFFPVWWRGSQHQSQVLASLSCSVIIQGTNYLRSVPLDMSLHQTHVSLRSELLIESPWEC